MQIVFFKDYMKNGRGAEAAVSDAAAFVSSEGHSCTLATCQDPGDPLSYPPPERVSILRTTEADAFDDINAIYPDAVISAGTNETRALVEGLRRRGLSRFPWPVVHQCHTNPAAMFKWRHPFRNARIREALSLVDAVQVLSPSFVEPLRRVAAFGPERTVVSIGNAIPEGRVAPGPSGNETLVLYPAALVKSKRPELALKAFAIAAAGRPSWRFALCGRGKPRYAARLSRLAQKLGIADRVDFPGYVPNLEYYVAKSAFIAFPSASEGLPMAIVEAMAAGRPVAGCRNAPGVDGLVRDGANGLLAAADPRSFAAALRSLMDDGALRLRLGENAREFVKSRYSREIVAGQWMDLLESL